MMDNYPRLAEFMAHHPETTIFRTFKTVTIENLLYLQAEIAHAEQELRDHTARAESTSDSGRRGALRSWSKLSQGLGERTEDDGDPPGCSYSTIRAQRSNFKHFAHWEKALDMRGLLSSYRKSVTADRVRPSIPEIRRQQIQPLCR